MTVILTLQEQTLNDIFSTQSMSALFIESFKNSVGAQTATALSITSAAFYGYYYFKSKQLQSIKK